MEYIQSKGSNQSQKFYPVEEVNDGFEIKGIGHYINISEHISLISKHLNILQFK